MGSIGTDVTDRQRPLNIACVAIPAMGHIIPTLNIADALVTKGHTVTLITADHGESLRPKVEKLGVKFATVNTGVSEDTWNNEILQDTGKATPQEIASAMFPLFDGWREDLGPLIKSLRLDAIVCDFFAFPAMEVAEKLKIPLIINWPGPASFVACMVGLPDPQTTWSLGGWTLGWSQWEGLKFAISMNVKGLRVAQREIVHHVHRAVNTMNTFNPIDPPRMLPPNFRMTGPICPQPKELKVRLPQNNPQLYSWLRSSSKRVVVITTGSMSELHEWQIKALYHGAKKAGLRIVWSLKDHLQPLLPVEAKGDADVWADAWIPQAEVLLDDAVAMVVTHCGWGGTLESIAAAQPCVCIPFMGDQPVNANLLIGAGCGELIGPPPKGVMTPINEWKEGAFTTESVAELFTRIIKNHQKYKSAAETLQRASRATGGVAAVVQEVEWAAAYGTDHRASSDMKRQIHGANPFTAATGYVGTALAGVAGCVVAHIPGMLIGCGLGACAAGVAAFVDSKGDYKKKRSAYRRKMLKGTGAEVDKMERAISRSFSNPQLVDY